MSSSTCPPFSPSPRPAHSFFTGPTVINIPVRAPGHSPGHGQAMRSATGGPAADSEPAASGRAQGPEPPRPWQKRGDVAHVEPAEIVNLDYLQDTAGSRNWSSTTALPMTAMGGVRTSPAERRAHTPRLRRVACIAACVCVCALFRRDSLCNLHSDVASVDQPLDSSPSLVQPSPHDASRRR